jgi:hypothetical protein
MREFKDSISGATSDSTPAAIRSESPVADAAEAA